MKYIKSLFVWIWLLFSPQKEVKEHSIKLLPLDLQFFSDDPPVDPPADPPGGNKDDEPFAAFKTEKDLNKRLTRAEKKGQKELATQLGYESVEDMLAALNKDKDKDKYTKHNKDTKDNPVDVDAVVEAKLKEERDKIFKRLVNSEVKVQAKELDFADWEDALALADLSEVKEDEKGNIVGVKEALEELAKKKPHLLKQKQQGRFGADIPNNQQKQKESLESLKKMAENRGARQVPINNPWAKN